MTSSGAWTSARSTGPAFRARADYYLCGPDGFMKGLGGGPDRAWRGCPSAWPPRRFGSVAVTRARGIVEGSVARPAPSPPVPWAAGPARDLRAQRPGRSPGTTAFPSLLELGRGLRRPGRVQLPDRRLPHVRGGPGGWRGRVHDRARWEPPADGPRARSACSRPRGRSSRSTSDGRAGGCARCRRPSPGGYKQARAAGSPPRRGSPHDAARSASRRPRCCAGALAAVLADRQRQGTYRRRTPPHPRPKLPARPAADESSGAATSRSSSSYGMPARPRRSGCSRASGRRCAGPT